ncbi:UDP-N-acetylglucosamine 4,6-dehydratase [Candidatus Pelagibacter sp. IMCC9063]|uniref:UDP-N-acetylglucosamine 4,6-dehydratase (inverting) n=1 Tax=Pelagibacter sp. (strain IMCC9063) TaxID=1002672 RepID=UPI00020464D0|nr:UDP-N-acetylglucosamine 4,6-dehydratase (inverting) [Candidatus Pelagibacter sp. IMCC9063]AEA80578.1 UDP-N-acetylglucosamine 4,6-dehydratase [Candidatus Pelagibacter sp. IMCC9063]|tara:strand:+ start:1060 stop:2088 length:1029 start_codon:yes stop_codon:yes gene_type:complete
MKNKKNLSILDKRSILITGGTGSFGKAFVNFLLNKTKVKKIIIYSRDEYKQEIMSKELHTSRERLRFFLGDVRDQKRLCVAMRDVDFVVHAAALKQVVAAEYNPQECIKTNINGAENVIFASMEMKVKKVIALSTDKAVNPINLYGATKLTSDKLFVAANNLSGKQKIAFSIVRYGNVVGSRGSVVQLYKEMISLGKKELPVTDAKMTRFWISLDEAVKFVMFSLEDSKGGEIYVPKIPAIKVVDVAKAFKNNIKIKIIGIRPGEKLHESLISLQDSLSTVEFKNYFSITPTIKFPHTKAKLFIKNCKGETGTHNKKIFEYSSENSKYHYTISKISKFLKNF